MSPAVLRRLGALLAALGLIGSFGVSSALAASITVNSLADVAANDGACTLREAITAANTDTASGAAAGECAAGSGADTISFSVSGTITLTSALPDISTDLTVAGAGAITVSGASSFRVFNVTAGTVTLSGLTISNGTAAQGGGIQNTGSGILTVTNSIFTGNTATTSLAGGAIFNSGTLTVTNSTFSGNTAPNGAGNYSVGAGILTVTNSTFSGNAANGGGGGIVNGGTAAVTNSTFSGNTATRSGCAIFNFAGPTGIAHHHQLDDQRQYCPGRRRHRRLGH